MRGSRHESGCASIAERVEGKAEPPSTDPDLDTPTQAETSSCIAKLRRSVVSVRSSPQRRNGFRASVSCGIPSKELVLDVRTRC